MPAQLPRGFDANWYRKTYPDVDASGMKPQEHFLLIGAALGRRPHARAAAGKAQRQVHSPQAAAPAVPQARPQEAFPIVARPADFNARAYVPEEAVEKQTKSGSTRTCGGVSFGPLHESLRKELSLDGPLEAYNALTGSRAKAADLTRYSDPCGAEMLSGKVALLQNAWFATSGLLRFQFAEKLGRGMSLRAYQADLSDLGQLHVLGQGIRLPEEAVAFWDIPLRNSLAPVIVEALDAQGHSLGVSLLPFPSLLRDGLHAAELKAVMPAKSPMEAFWVLSQMALWEYAKKGDGTLSHLLASLNNVTGAEPLFRQDVQTWLAAVFGLILDVEQPVRGGEGLQALCDEILAGESLPAHLRGQAPKEASGVTLRLPDGGLPTIAALTAQGISFPGRQHVTGSYLVAEGSSLRPRWIVTLPQDLASGTAIPQLLRNTAEPAGRDATLPRHLAIVPRPPHMPHEARLLHPRGDWETVPAAEAVTVLLQASSEERTARLLASLQAQFAAGVDLDLRVVMSGTAAEQREIRNTLDNVRGTRGWQAIPTLRNLRSVMCDARHAWVLVISDQISLYDETLLAQMQATLQADDHAASLSPMLLGETVVGKRTVIQPASGGLFPGSVSLSVAPQLGIIEPDVSQPLPRTCYPVLANTLHLVLFRKDAVASLEAQPADSDVQIGLDLLQAGWRNLCNSRLRAGILGTYRRRDEIDMIRGDMLSCGRWEQTLSKITVLRELF